jgi:hypothetical protein
LGYSHKQISLHLVIKKNGNKFEGSADLTKAAHAKCMANVKLNNSKKSNSAVMKLSDECDLRWRGNARDKARAAYATGLDEKENAAVPTNTRKAAPGVADVAGGSRSSRERKRPARFRSFLLE